MLPTSPDRAASFLAGAGSPTTVNLDTNVTVGSIQFDGTDGYTISSSGAISLTLQADPGGTSVLRAATGTHTISVPIALAINAVVFGAGNLNLTVAISGHGAGMNIQSTGVVTLSGANTYTGQTTIGSGTRVGDGTTNTGSLRSNITNNANLTFANPGPLGYAGVISGTGAVTKTGAGVLTLTAVHTYTGATTVSGGTLTLGAGTSLAPTFRISRPCCTTPSKTTPTTRRTPPPADSTAPPTAAPASSAVNSAARSRLTARLSMSLCPIRARWGLSAYTVSEWVKLNNQNGTTLFATRTGGDTTFDMQYTSGVIHGDIGSGGGWLNTAANSGAVSLPTGTWNMVTYSVGFGGYNIYVNGVSRPLSGSGIAWGAAKLVDEERPGP